LFFKLNLFIDKFEEKLEENEDLLKEYDEFNRIVKGLGFTKTRNGEFTMSNQNYKFKIKKFDDGILFGFKVNKNPIYSHPLFSNDFHILSLDLIPSSLFFDTSIQLLCSIITSSKLSSRPLISSSRKPKSSRISS
jgi:hypothetical protein